MKRIFIHGVIIVVILTIIVDTKATNPPGTKRVKIKNKPALYVDQHTISNIDWKEALCWLRSCSEEKIGTTECVCICQHKEKNSALEIDSIVWKQRYGAIEKTKAIKSLPIIGISSAQMATYCRIRSKLVNFKFPKQKVNYELLTEEDYQELLAARWKYLDNKSEFGEMTANGTIFFQGNFIPMQNFHGPITFRCKAVMN